MIESNEIPVRIRSVSPRCGKFSIDFPDVILPGIVLIRSWIETLVGLLVRNLVLLFLVPNLLLLLLLEEADLVLLLLVFKSLQFLLVSKQRLLVLFVLRRNDTSGHQQDERENLTNRHSVQWISTL